MSLLRESLLNMNLLLGDNSMKTDGVIAFPGTDLSSLPDELIPAIRYDGPEFLALRRKRAERERRGSFVLGPIPLTWISACQEAGPGALALALGIRAYGKMRGGAVPVSDAFARRVGVKGADQRRRALTALEAAGLARVERKPGCAPTVILVPWKAKPTAEGAA